MECVCLENGEYVAKGQHTVWDCLDHRIKVLHALYGMPQAPVAQETTTAHKVKRVFYVSDVR